MNERELLDDFADLPPEARRQVMDFIAFLKSRYKTPRPGKKPKRGDLASEPFIGMWRDREDLKDSTAWVRSIRRQQWAKSGE